MSQQPRRSEKAEGEERSPVAEGHAAAASATTARGGASRGRSRSRASSAGQRADDRRQKLVSAALKLFSTHAYDDISIDDIATEANVAHGLASYYFGGKRGLYLAAQKMVQDDLQALTRPILTDGDVAAQIKGMARRHFEYFRAHPEIILRLLVSSPSDPESRAVTESTHQAGARELLRLLGLSVDPPPLLRTALRGCMGYLYQVTVEWLVHGEDVPLEELVDLCFDVVVAAVGNATSALSLAPDANL